MAKRNPIVYEKIKYSDITPEKSIKIEDLIKSIGLGSSYLAMSAIPFVNKSFANERDKLTLQRYNTYNNYYEFGTSKSDPYRNSQIFKTHHGKLVLKVRLKNRLNYLWKKFLKCLYLRKEFID